MIRFPAVFDPDPESGGYAVTFPDVPEGVTCGDNDAEAMAMARDCLVTVLTEYIRQRRDIPLPSAARGRKQRLVELPLQASLKIALYEAWRGSGVRKSDLARRMGIPKTVVDRLFDLNHGSRMEQIEAAFRALGKRVEIQVADVRRAA